MIRCGCPGIEYRRRLQAAALFGCMGLEGFDTAISFIRRIRISAFGHRRATVVSGFRY